MTGDATAHRIDILTEVCKKRRELWASAEAELAKCQIERAAAERVGAEKMRATILQYHETRRAELWEIAATENGIAGAHSAAHGESIETIKGMPLPGEK